MKKIDYFRYILIFMEFITLFHFKNDIHSEVQIKVFKFIDKNFLVLEPPKSKKDLVKLFFPYHSKTLFEIKEI